MARFEIGTRTEVDGGRRASPGLGSQVIASFLVAVILIAAACGREQSGDGPGIHRPGVDGGTFPALPDAQASSDRAWPALPPGCENSPLREPFTRIIAQPGPDPAGAFTGYVIAAGDVDGVRGADFIVSGEKTALYLNDGSGSFTRKLIYEGPLGLMQAVDLDGDGDQDFVGTRSEPRSKTGSLDIIRNDGQGNFTVETVGRTDLAFYGAVVADIDGDGARDVIVNERPPGSESSPDLSIYAFTQLATTPRRTTVFQETGIPQTGSLVGGDLDDDGDVDLVVLREPERNKYFHHVVWNEGGRFVLDPQPLPLLNWAPVVADIDGDGAIDLAGGNLLLHNVGRRQFAPIALDDGPSTGTGDAVVAADHDGDGDLDLLLRRRGDVTILRQDSPLRFSKGRRPIPGQPFFEFSFDYGVYERLAVADVEGDGRLDLLLSDRSHRVHVIPGDLLGASFTWKRPVREVPTGFFPKGLSSADLEGDGDLDLIAIGGGGVVAFANDGHGAFTPSGPFNSPDGRDPYKHFALADMDRDGRIDVVTTTERGRLSIFRHLGDGGGYGLQSIHQAHADGVDLPAVTGLGAADVDGDGRVDLVVSQGHDEPSARGAVWLLWNDAATGFASTSLTTVELPPVRLLALADLDGDARPEIVTASAATYREGSVTVHRVSPGRVVTQVRKHTLPAPTALAMGDLDQDGFPEVVSAGGFLEDHSVTVLWNDRKGSFGRSTRHVAGYPVDTLQVADVDGDGRRDAVLGGRNAGEITALLNEGEGRFFPWVRLPAQDPVGMVVADLDGRCGPDIAVNNMGTFSIWLYLAGAAAP